MKRRVYFFSWLDQRGVWSYKSTLISRKSFLASGISLYLGEAQMKICERSLQALLSSPPPTPPPPAPLLLHTSLMWLPFARPNGEHGEQRLLYHYLLMGFESGNVGTYRAVNSLG